MSRAEKMILAGTAAIVLLILILDAIAPREPNWNTSFTRYKTDLYACGLTYDRLGDLFPQGVTTVREPIYSTAEQRLALDSAAPRVNHIFIDGSFSLDDLDLRHLLMMVEAGDDAFIAAEDFYGLIQDTLNFSTAYHWEQPDTTSMAREVKTFFTNDTDAVRFTVFPLRNDTASRFARGGFEESFNHFPVDSTQVLAENQRHDPVLIRIRIGKGFLYLCSVPRAFTNYYLLKDEARPFMESAFSLLPNRPVLWDEYYKVGRDGSQTPLRYILEQPALRGAYWTAIALLLLTVLVYARRRQRAIPVVEPPRNTSREFADTIARDYPRLDLLVNNAGIAFNNAPARSANADGYELQFVVNYLAGWILANRLLPNLEAAAPSRVVNIASGSAAAIDFDDVMLEKPDAHHRGYGQSKLAQVMMTMELAPAFAGRGVTMISLHPATLMDTTMVKGIGIPPRTTVAEGRDHVMGLVTAPALQAGAYYEQGQPATPRDPQATDPQARARLVALSAELTGVAAAR